MRCTITYSREQSFHYLIDTLVWAVYRLASQHVMQKSDGHESRAYIDLIY